MLITILSNIVVALVVLFLIGIAIRALLKQQKQEGCPSCGTSKSNGCKGCPYAGREQ